ncbi:GNAT family N-acetyltransferase [Bacillus idriensis]|uniref:GNAT family N-acetyltransferase n=1 Tax=Metabacillus idriensis TaxID=324768 RepID=A0A6I2MEG6_9BACI|nr:GNAT family N-acetyltransferase [Metabacillus idriensis]MRX56139.1 GNAT family N-acetyltransferase [Metabacillus idriensis]
MKKNLSNERLLLREFTESDWIGVHKYASKEKVCQYQDWGPNSEEESQAFVKQVLVDAAKKPRTRYMFAIVLKKEEKMIGAGEINIRDFNHKNGEIGYIINPDYWGRGIATDVAKLLIEFGFSTFNLHRIFAYCDPRNIGSKKVIEKVGMTMEGRLRENLLIKDGWRDSLLYSVLEHK